MSWILAAIGGAIGATIRYGAYIWLDGRLSKATDHWIHQMPGVAGTWLVNVSGCLLIGIVATSLGERVFEDEKTRAFLIVGLFGGFTTMSALGLEGWNLFRDGQLIKGMSLALIQTLVCVLMVGLGATLGKLIKLS